MDQHFTFYIDGTPTREIVRACLALGLVTFPSPEWQAHCLDGAPRPRSKFDELPEGGDQ